MSDRTTLQASASGVKRRTVVATSTLKFGGGISFSSLQEPRKAVASMPKTMDNQRKVTKEVQRTGGNVWGEEARRVLGRMARKAVTHVKEFNQKALAEANKRLPIKLGKMARTAVGEVKQFGKAALQNAHQLIMNLRQKAAEKFSLRSKVNAISKEATRSIQVVRAHTGKINTKAYRGFPGGSGSKPPEQTHQTGGRGMGD